MLAAAMEPGSVAGVLVLENRWAAPFANATRRAGGQLIANGRIPIQAIVASIEARAGLGRRELTCLSVPHAPCAAESSAHPSPAPPPPSAPLRSSSTASAAAATVARTGATAADAEPPSAFLSAKLQPAGGLVVHDRHLGAPDPTEQQPRRTAIAVTGNVCADSKPIGKARVDAGPVRWVAGAGGPVAVRRPR